MHEMHKNAQQHNVSYSQNVTTEKKVGNKYEQMTMGPNAEIDWNWTKRNETRENEQKKKLKRSNAYKRVEEKQ